MGQYGVAIKGIGISLPPSVVKNDDLTQLVETSDEWIYSRTGFKQRHVVAGDETVTDLGIEASKQALAFAGMDGSEIDLIVYNCSTPDEIYPQGCGVVQQAIGATNAFGFDMGMACSGLVYALGIATQFLENGTAKNALVVGADIHSRYTDWYDRNTCVLFGDGAGAFVLSRTNSPVESDILAMDFILDGSRGQEIKIPVQRDNCPLVAPRTTKDKSAIYMNGREVFKFAVGDIPVYVGRALEKAGIGFEEVDHFVFHQANDRIMNSMVERMNVKPEQIIVHLENYGNTSAASIALALNEALEKDEIKHNSTMVLCGFGAGLAVATAVVKWNCIDQRKAKQRSAAQGEVALKSV